MAALSLVLLAVGVVGTLARPRPVPAWVVPSVAAVVTVAAGALSLDGTRTALDPLRAPIGFLLAAVPLAILLDRLGFFEALAALVGRTGHGVGGLWVLAALVTTVLNLDASVVLSTPLYVRVARSRGQDPLLLAFIPVLLACLASSALPVSNLTNLIAASATGASTADFVTHLGLPSLVATAVGWWCFRRISRGGLDAAPAAAAEELDEGKSRALRRGGLVVAVVLLGFVAGRDVGIQPWMVALGADAVLAVLLRDLPWRQVPIGTALVAASLGVLASAAAGHLPIHRLLEGTSTAASARTIGVTALAANVANNLPALLVTLPELHHRDGPALWAVLLGVNMGPVVLVTGSLASLLWMGALGRLGVAVRAWDFTWVGLRVGVPGASAGVGVYLALHAAGV